MWLGKSITSTYTNGQATTATLTIISNRPFLKYEDQKEEHFHFFLIYRENMQCHDLRPILSLVQIHNL